MNARNASKGTGPGMRLLHGALSAVMRIGPAVMASAALFSMEGFFPGATAAGKMAVSAIAGTFLSSTCVIAAGCFLNGKGVRPCPREPAVPPEAVEQEWKARLAAGAARIRRINKQRADAGFVPVP